MNKQIIFSQVSAFVADTTGIPVPLMLTSTAEDCTDARFLLIRALSTLSLTDTDIARCIGRTRQAVGYLRSSYKRGRKWTIENDWQTIRKWIENQYFKSK